MMSLDESFYEGLGGPSGVYMRGILYPLPQFSIINTLNREL